MAKKTIPILTRGKETQTECCNNKNNTCAGGAGCVYGLGVIGAAFYYIPLATGFWGVIVAILKSIVWPAFLVYKLLGL